MTKEATSPVTVTQFTDRFGNECWEVKWGPGVTQMVICMTEADRDHAVKNRTQVLLSQNISPLANINWG